jgi:hypothetical protein
MTLADIVVDQLVFVLGAPDDVLDPDSAIVVLQDVMTRMAELPADQLAPVRHVAEARLTEGQQSEEIEGALRELVLLLDEIDAA